MTTISDENGIINNFAKEPAMYYAEEPSSQDQRSYLIWGALAFVVVVGSVFTAAAVS
ncbi:MAG: ssl1498 family light-harvesting-like protein [Cyanobacteria bacterium J06629_2]